MIRRLSARAARRLGLRRSSQPEQVLIEELQMVWPRARLRTPPTWVVPEGYSIRTYQQGDELDFFALMERSGFPGWNMHEFQLWLRKILPRGFFFAVDRCSARIVATAMACHNPAPLHPFGATLSCVAVDPNHRGKGLGYVVSAIVTDRLLRAGYSEIYMQTDDWRIAAIRTYLKLGWITFLFGEDMSGRWEAVCRTLGWPYTPEIWSADKVNI